MKIILEVPDERIEFFRELMVSLNCVTSYTEIEPDQVSDFILQSIMQQDWQLDLTEEDWQEY